MATRNWIAAALLGGTALMGTAAHADTSFHVQIGASPYYGTSYYGGSYYYPDRHWGTYRYGQQRYGRSPDRDRDGIPDRRDWDLDNDGRANRYDRDMDGDGVSNRRDRAPANRYRY